MELTVHEVAERLNIPVETIHRWVRQGKIPMQTQRGGHTIHHEMLERWASEHKLKIHEARRQTPGVGVDTDIDGILPAMQRGGVFYDIQGNARETALRSAVDLIPSLKDADRDIIYEKLIEREQLASTGIGHGIALPHPRTAPGIVLGKPQITTCFLKQPVAFDAIDNRPVSIMMVLLSCSTKQHLSLLSKLAYYLRDAAFRDYLLAVPAKDDLLSRIERMDADAE